ncbi:MAG: hypothetical protein IJR53_11140 [Bacteroidales bacterium]|nr:hypothetical protein [Bacteroidales bacterium]
MAISATIQALISGEQVAGSKLSSKLIDELMAEGLLLVVPHGSRKSYCARDIEALKRYLIDKDESYRMLEVCSFVSRASLAAETGNSKLMTVRSCPGFPINSYQSIECQLNNEPFIVNPQEGSFFFVDKWMQFTIPKDIIVVGIENMENFRMIRYQRRLFESVLGDSTLLFVSRYPQSTDLRNWLMQISNKYVHFGDFDLAGLCIYETEFNKYLSNRASFFIPEDIEVRLQNGSTERYNKQYDKFKNYKPTDNRLMILFNLIHKYHRCYDQEGYIIW